MIKKTLILSALILSLFCFQGQKNVYAAVTCSCKTLADGSYFCPDCAFVPKGLDPSPVPEPPTVALMLAGLVGMAALTIYRSKWKGQL